MYLIWQFTLMSVSTINKDHLVMNISEHFFVLIDQDKTFLSHRKFDNYCQLPYWIIMYET